MIYDNMMCLERPGSKLRTEGRRKRWSGQGPAGGNSSILFRLRNCRPHSWVSHQLQLLFVFCIPSGIISIQVSICTEIRQSGKYLHCINIHWKGKN